MAEATSIKATLEQVQALGSSLSGDVASAWAALESLTKVEWEALTANAFKAGGHLGHVLKWMDAPHPIIMRTASAMLVHNLMQAEASFSPDAIQAGIVGKICAAMDDPNAELILATLKLMRMCLVQLDERSRKDPSEDFFRLGGITKTINLVTPSYQDSQVAMWAARLLTWFTDQSRHHRFRDTIIVQSCVDRASSEPEPLNYIIVLSNLASSESMHLCIRAAGAKEKLKCLLDNPDEVVRSVLLIMMAHAYNCADDKEVDDLLCKFDISTFLLGALKSGLTKDQYAEMNWSVLEASQNIQAVARNGRYALELLAGGGGQLLVQALAGDGTKSRETEELIAICRAFWVLANHNDTHEQLLACGVVEALTRYVNSSDLRVADAARGALLLMGELQDLEAETAAAVAAAPLHTVRYDVFLSHKRTDSKDFARALYNLLVLRGFSTFLDCEYREELENLEAIVATCTNFIFILTDNIFESKWCLKELTAAATAGVNIILLVKEGSRWKDSSGSPICEFPPYSLIESLPEGVRKVFSRKALSHSDEYYQAFVEMLLQKLKREEQGNQGAPVPCIAPAPNLPTRNSAASVAQNHVTSSQSSVPQLAPVLSHSQTFTAAPVASPAPIMPRLSFASLPTYPPPRSSILTVGEGPQVYV